MSYLDVPRIHFSGRFRANVSTLNNLSANHNNAAPALVPEWNPDGNHHFELLNCAIRGVTDGTGTLLTNAAQDVLIGGRVESVEGPARMVDLDPQHQTGTQIWGHKMRITASNGDSVTGTMTVTEMREMYSRAPGGLSGFGAGYLTQLTDLVWNPLTAPYASMVLSALSSAARQRWSLKFVVYAYDPVAASPTFTTGMIAGTLGPVAAGEPAHMLPERKLVNLGLSVPLGSGGSAALNSAPFKVDTARRRLVVDLGNALPEVAAGGARVALGTLTAEVGPPGAPVRIGTLPNDSTRYLTNAGIEELPLTAAQVTALATRPLRIKAGTTVGLSERTTGMHMDVGEATIRLNPRAPAATDRNPTLPSNTLDVEVLAARFGRPAAGATITVDVTPIGAAPAAALSLRGPAGPLSPLPATLTTGPTGRVPLTLVAGSPGTPRPHIDGAVYRISIFEGAAVSANRHAFMVVRVFSARAVPPAPVYADVEAILTRYARLYPSMRAFVDMGIQARMAPPMSALLEAALLRPITDPHYMPVSRDLSLDATKLLADWFRRGAP